MKDTQIGRREFLKTGGLGALGLAALPGLDLSLPEAAAATWTGRSGYVLVAMSTAGVVGDVTHVFGITGYGTFGRRFADGGGSYIHVNMASEGFPKELLESGTWRTERLIDWKMPESPNIPYGPFYSGILDLKIRIFPQGGHPWGVPARMAMI